MRILIRGVQGPGSQALPLSPPRVLPPLVSGGGRAGGELETVRKAGSSVFLVEPLILSAADCEVQILYDVLLILVILYTKNCIERVGHIHNLAHPPNPQGGRRE